MTPMQAFVNIGLVPDVGSTYFLTQLVGYNKVGRESRQTWHRFAHDSFLLQAVKIMVEGRRIYAPECQRLGLCEMVGLLCDL